jgi:hypothetical protein
MIPRIVLLVFAITSLSFYKAEAQQPKKIPRIVYLSVPSLSEVSTARYEAFHQGLRDLGYVEGKEYYR